MRRFWLYRVVAALSQSALAGFDRAFYTLLRAAFYPFPNSGLPRGGFSLLQQLRENAVTGRIILENQGNPAATPESLMIRSGLHQHEEQPWPIFWTQRKSATLVGDSLALLNSKKEICVESVFGERRFEERPGMELFYDWSGAAPPGALDKRHLPVGFEDWEDKLCALAHGGPAQARGAHGVS